MTSYTVTYIDETTHFKGETMKTQVAASSISEVFEVLKSFGFNCNSITNIEEVLA